ncbi:complement factor H-like [Parambassis ranga]|uniref:Complement factor H-like n=1 Tax=Parambassis ranga TaxID=210632 RepID=A0A6P7I7Z9_9TELE|nr:complement factor H-like [Parambassis ranga]
MHLITKSCVLLLWMQTLGFVNSQDCTLEQFTSSNLYDTNFDISNLASSYRQGKEVRVPCIVGYSGFFKLICTENGWQSRSKKCEPKSCGHPGDADFADFSLEYGDDYVFGSRVVYTCHKGFHMVSRKNYRRCMANGWDGKIPVCEAKKCSAIKLGDHIIVSGDMEEANYGNALRFRCRDSNHALYGSAEINCKENGEWSDSPPECRGVTCSRPQIQRGHVTGDTQVYNKDQYLTFECDDGYQPVEDRPSKCSKVGNRAEWSPTPMCEGIKCKVKLTQGTQYNPPYKDVFLPGETLRVMCGEREWISNRQTTSAETTCQDDGQWTIDPVCREVTCSRPPDRSLQRWDANRGQQIKLGDSIWYDCKQGYKKPSYNTWATCTRDEWTPNPLCKETTCPRKVYPRAEIVGDIQSEYRYNQRVEYACNNGFEGTFTITCRDNGWSPASQQCRVITCNRLDIEDATNFNPKSKYQHNEVVTYSCRVGKTLTLTCQNGDWIGPKACSACPKATIEHGFIAGPYNDLLYFACDEGYKPFTKGWWGEAKCKDGQWSGLHNCIANTTCGEPPRIPNGKINSTNGRITCNEGYSTHTTSLECHEGKWNLINPKICQPINILCDHPPRVKNAVVSGSYKKKYLAGSLVTYQCRDKYKPEREHRLRCIAGQWEEKNINCIPYCESLRDERKTMIFTTQNRTYVNGDVIKYKCFASEEEGNATCMDSEWITTVTCKAKTCEEPEIFNGYHYSLNNSELIYGVIIKYVCDDRYKMVGEGDTNKCLLDGWDKPHPTCQQITCELRASDPNLRVNPQPDDNEPFTVGRKLRFSCIDDLGLTGPSEIECLNTGLWSDDVPTCSEKCQVTKPPQNVNVNPPEGSRLMKGEQLTFSCRQRGQVIKGKTTVECLENAQWSDDFPTCGDPSYCGKPPPLLDGDTATIVSKSQYNHNEKVQYSCQRFYIMQGEPYMTCLNGEWIGEMKCLQPCTVDKAAMDERNIRFRYTDRDKLYAPHGDHLTFYCTRGTPDDQIPMRQMCNNGVITLPRCM